MSTPKMRGFKQIFLTMKLYNNNTFVDGKKVEYAHQLGKGLQTKHSNWKQQYKDNVSDKSFGQLVMSYAVNGGRWGSNWEYGLGESLLNLKDPFKAHLPHPCLLKWLIPANIENLDKLEIGRFWTEKESRKRDWDYIYSGDTINQLFQLLENHFDTDVNVRWGNLDQLFRMKHIQSFRFHAGLLSFGVNFADHAYGKQARCQVKITGGYVSEFKDAFAAVHVDGRQVLLFKGRFWKVFGSRHPNTWVNDLYSSMDYIDWNRGFDGWTFMNKIVEPVLLIHNCVKFPTVQATLPDPWRSMDVHKYNRNCLYFYHRLKMQVEAANNNSNRPPSLPCGPFFQCIKHQAAGCTRCKSDDGQYDRTHFDIVWECNTSRNPHWWVWDSANGLGLALTGTVNKWKKTDRYQW